MALVTGGGRGTGMKLEFIPPKFSIQKQSGKIKKLLYPFKLLAAISVSESRMYRYADITFARPDFFW